MARQIAFAHIPVKASGMGCKTDNNGLLSSMMIKQVEGDGKLFADQTNLGDYVRGKCASMVSSQVFGSAPLSECDQVVYSSTLACQVLHSIDERESHFLD